MEMMDQWQDPMRRFRKDECCHGQIVSLSLTELIVVDRRMARTRTTGVVALVLIVVVLCRQRTRALPTKEERLGRVLRIHAVVDAMTVFMF